LHVIKVQMIIIYKQ